MLSDSPLCLCFHISQRKVWNYLRIHQPQRASQLSECFGAGTGCGWCRPYLERMFQSWQAGGLQPDDLPAANEYAWQRTQYVQAEGANLPLGATPIDQAPPDGSTH
jgi:bacterioferritin-associated ferredoxin